jgi:hypothetical protein
VWPIVDVLFERLILIYKESNPILVLVFVIRKKNRGKEIFIFVYCNMLVNSYHLILMYCIFPEFPLLEFGFNYSCILLFYPLISLPSIGSEGQKLGIFSLVIARFLRYVSPLFYPWLHKIDIPERIVKKIKCR